VGFTYQIDATNNPTGYDISGLPTGLVPDNSTGSISGTPTQSGTFTATISAINLGGTDTETLTLTILPPLPAITSPLTVSGTTGAAFSYQIEASNNPVSFNAIGLPAGLSVDTSTGLISGTPAGGGLFPVTISAANIDGGTGSATLALTVTTSFGRLAGTYEGLAALDGTNIGLLTLSLKSNGAFTGKVTLPADVYSLKGTFSSYGTFGTIQAVGATTLTVVLDVNAALPGVSGTVAATTFAGTETYNVQSTLLGKFNAKNPLPKGLAGYYTEIIPGLSGTDPTLPHAPGYGTMSVNTLGAVHLAGRLGDGTVFSAGGQLHADGKTWTLYTPLYAKRNPGSLAGTMTFEALPDSDCDGSLDWIRPPQPTAKYYPTGFSAAVDLLAAKYAPPALASGTASLTLEDGNLPDPGITDDLTISSTEKVTVTGPTPITGTTVTITPRTGVFTGKFPDPITKKETPFGGVIYKKPSAAGFGLFLGTDQTGSVGIMQ
jgi:hypothetical protein